SPAIDAPEDKIDSSRSDAYAAPDGVGPPVPDAPTADVPTADAPPPRPDTKADANPDVSADRTVTVPDSGPDRTVTVPDSGPDLPSDPRFDALPDLRVDGASDSNRDTSADRNPDLSEDRPRDAGDAGPDLLRDTSDLAIPDAGSNTRSPGLWVLAGVLAGPGALDGIGPVAQFYFPSGAALDGAGNLYIADAANNTIRKIVLATREVTTIAGLLGVTGSDDGVGAKARFFSPQGLATDGAGNLYIADSVNSTVRKLVLATNEVTTLAGSPNATAYRDGRGGAARFESPTGLAYDGAGSLFVTDLDGTIRRIVLDTAEVTTLAGRATAQGSQDGTGTVALFSRPQGIACDGAGTLYVADTGNYAIRKIVVATAAVTTLAGLAGSEGDDDGVGTAARFSSPLGLALDQGGNLFVADFGGASIRKVVLSTAEVSTLVWSGSVGEGDYSVNQIDQPVYLACDGAGILYATDSSKHTVLQIVTATKAMTTLAGRASSAGTSDGVGAAAQFHEPSGLVSDNRGGLLIADSYNQCIRRVDIATGSVTTVAGMVGPGGHRDGTGSEARFNYPAALAYDGMGILFIADQNNHAIRQLVLATGLVTTLAGTPGMEESRNGTGSAAHFITPAGLALDGGGNLFVADLGAHTIRKIALANAAVTTLAGRAGSAGSSDGSGTQARFNGPSGLAYSAAGDLFVADTLNCTVRQIELATGSTTTLAGAAGLCDGGDGMGGAAHFQMPGSLALDSAGRLLVADIRDNTVRRLDVVTGQVTTIVGHSGRWETIPGPLPAYVAAPAGLAVLPSGDIAITDSYENVVLLAQF
ncbi:MAG TPA: hypothetical protein VF518_01275, partial [Polyangia bacterium]